MLLNEFNSLLAGIGNEFGALKKELGAISQRVVGEIKGNPVGYLRASARELTQMGIRHPVLATIGGEAPSLFDKVHRSVSMPVEGSILYVDLLGEYAQHSGIYIGNGEIVELSGKGCIQRVSREQFINGGTGRDIYVSCRNNVATGSPTIAQRARSALGLHREYNIFLNNCHQFCAGCLTGNFENSDNFLWMLKHSAQVALGTDSWHRWK